MNRTHPFPCLQISLFPTPQFSPKFAYTPISMLTDTFLKRVAKYTRDQNLANDLWLEIFTKYSDPKRHYHAIPHLENIIAELNEISEKIENYDTAIFAAFYHDIIYKATSSSNEEDSAKLAAQRLTEIDFPTAEIKKCTAMIMATKSHKLSADSDTNYFTDADLAILGQNSLDYREYREGVRNEYSNYPDFLYNPGRKKILQQFLQSPTIFKTPHFCNKYEDQARLNIANELGQL